MLCLQRKHNSRKQFAAGLANAQLREKPKGTNMITLEERPGAAAKFLPAGADPAGSDAGLVSIAGTAMCVGTTMDAGTFLDAGLQRTLSSRLHCRRPMELVDPDAVSPLQPLQVGGHSTGTGAGPATAERPVTYRCQCGFTMDADAFAQEFASAN